MKIKVIKQDGKKESKKLYFCWNAKEHPVTYSEVVFEGDYKQGELVPCPVCKKYHKISERMDYGNKN